MGFLDVVSCMFQPEALSAVSDVRDLALAPIPFAMPVVPVVGHSVIGAAGAAVVAVAAGTPSFAAAAVSVDAVGYLKLMSLVGLFWADLDLRHRGPSFLDRVYNFVVDFSCGRKTVSCAAPTEAAQWFVKSTR